MSYANFSRGNMLYETLTNGARDQTDWESIVAHIEAIPDLEKRHWESMINWLESKLIKLDGDNRLKLLEYAQGKLAK